MGGNGQICWVEIAKYFHKWVGSEDLISALPWVGMVKIFDVIIMDGNGQMQLSTLSVMGGYCQDILFQHSCNSIGQI